MQGREAAPSGWRGPQRSEDTGQAGLSLVQNGRVAMRREKAAPKADRPDLANDMEQCDLFSQLKTGQAGPACCFSSLRSKKTPHLGVLVYWRKP